MATDNKAVMCYLPKDLESFVSQYCEDNELVSNRNGVTSPRLGTGIIRILDNLMKGNKSFTESKAGKDCLPTIDIEQLVKDQVNTAKAELRDELKPEPLDINQIKNAVLEALTEPEKK